METKHEDRGHKRVEGRVVVTAQKAENPVDHALSLFINEMPVSFLIFLGLVYGH
jgi:hypothetical protein